jgi:hypothetical protein
MDLTARAHERMSVAEVRYRGWVWRVFALLGTQQRCRRGSNSDSDQPDELHSSVQRESK